MVSSVILFGSFASVDFSLSRGAGWSQCGHCQGFTLTGGFYLLTLRHLRQLTILLHKRFLELETLLIEMNYSVSYFPRTLFTASDGTMSHISLSIRLVKIM